MQPSLNPRSESTNAQAIALKVKLARADRTIARLIAEQAQLRAQIARLQRRQASAQASASPRRSKRPVLVSNSKQAYSPPNRLTLAQNGKRRPSQPVTLRQRSRQPVSLVSNLVQRRTQRSWRLRLFDQVILVSVGLVVATLVVTHRVYKPVVPPQRTAQSNQQIQPTAPIHPSQTIEDLVYNVQSPQPLAPDAALQTIVDGAVALAASQSLSTEPLSITLIDLKANTIAGYQKEIPRYPASVVKLFWLVVCEAQLENGILQPDPALNADLNAMIVHSDNDAASRIFDHITQTTSGGQISGEEYGMWLKRRLRLNQFFRAAGYDGLSISQKNYPIYSLKLDAPDGRELQMRDEQQQPIRSLITSDQTARLMHEIYAGKAVSASRSQEMIALLTRDLNPDTWKKQPDNSIAGFLGESLPADVRFASKVGMTTKARHEVAFIESKDGKVAYILAVFGADPTYSQNSEILPVISNAVYTQMMERNAQAGAIGKGEG